VTGDSLSNQPLSDVHYKWMDVTDDFFKAVKGMIHSEKYNEVPVRCLLLTRKNLLSLLCFITTLAHVQLKKLHNITICFFLALT
jgi:hypothetical protein